MIGVGAFALAVVTGLTGAASAQGTWDGYLSGGGGSTSYSYPYSLSFSGGYWQGRGTFENALPNGWGFQGDAVYGNQDTSAFYPESTLAVTDLAAHVFDRRPGQWLFGGMFQYRNENLGNSSDSVAVDQYYVAAEVQGYWRQLSLYGQLGWQESTQEGSTGSGVAARLRGRFFFNPQWFVEASVQAEQWNNSGQTANYLNLGLATEYQFAAAPVSVFVRYNHFTQDSPDYGNFGRADRIMVGAKWNFGGKSLWDRETGGASLDPFDTVHIPEARG